VRSSSRGIIRQRYAPPVRFSTPRRSARGQTISDSLATWSPLCPWAQLKTILNVPEHRNPAKSSASGKGGSHRRGRSKKRSFSKELPILIAVALVLTILIQQFVAKAYMIPSGYMETTVHGCTGCTGDRILVDRVTYNFTSWGGAFYVIGSVMVRIDSG
jgi:hypothetical protein